MNFFNSNGDLIGIYLLAGNRLSNNIINDISSYRRMSSAGILETPSLGMQ